MRWELSSARRVSFRLWLAGVARAAAVVAGGSRGAGLGVWAGSGAREKQLRPEERTFKKHPLNPRNLISPLKP